MTTSSAENEKGKISCAPFSKMSKEEIDVLLKKCTNVYPAKKGIEAKVPLLGIADCNK